MSHLMPSCNCPNRDTLTKVSMGVDLSGAPIENTPGRHRLFQLLDPELPARPGGPCASGGDGDMALPNHVPPVVSYIQHAGCLGRRHPSLSSPTGVSSLGRRFLNRDAACSPRGRDRVGGMWDMLVLAFLISASLTFHVKSNRQSQSSTRL